MKSRSEYINNADWLFYLQNSLGNNNLKICGGGMNPDGDIYFTKRYNFLELTEMSPWDKVATNTRGTFLVQVCKFIQNATHRSILDIELCIDIDEVGEYKTIKDKTRSIIIKLRKLQADFKIYFTGSKSYHIHLFDKDLRKLNKEQLSKFLYEIGADSQKVGNNMIAIEGATHYKSGKKKEEVSINEFIDR